MFWIDHLESTVVFEFGPGLSNVVRIRGTGTRTAKTCRTASDVVLHHPKLYILGHVAQDRLCLKIRIKGLRSQDLP